MLACIRILVDWLIELYDELQLPAEVLLDGVFHVDRFLSNQEVLKEVSVCFFLGSRKHIHCSLRVASCRIHLICRR